MFFSKKWHEECVFAKCHDKIFIILNEKKNNIKQILNSEELNYIKCWKEKEY